MGWISDLFARWFRPDPPQPPQPPQPVRPPAFDPAEVEKLLPLHNEERIRAGRDLLRTHLRVQMAAQRHADQMAREDALAHDGIGDGSVGTRLSQAGYVWSGCAENIAWNTSTAQETMSVWLSSTMHHKNILGPYSDFGAAAAVNRKGQPYWCVVFGEPRD